MGVITLARSITRPLRRTAQTMTARHALIIAQLRARSAPGQKQFEDDPTAGLWFPEDIGENELSTYPCDPTGDPAYTDQYRILNQNPVVVTAVPIQLALENRKRKEMFLVNVSTSTILVAFGFVPTTTIYTLPLQACGIANDGTGGIIIDQAWQGTVWAILQAGAAGNGAMLFTELPE